MKKIKQLANNAFVRPDRTEVLSARLQESERRIDQIKLSCETLAKKVHECLLGRGKDGGIDKRIRKVPEFQLGNAMIQNGKHLGEWEGSILGEVLAEAGQIEMKLGQAVVEEYEMKIEENILKPLQLLMENDLPNIYKLKRQLAKCTADMDMAKAKHTQVSRNSMTVGHGSKVDNIKEEWEETQVKVEQCRDNLAAEMYALIARESEISKLVVDFLNIQKDYHLSVHSILKELISNVETCVATSYHKPVYGQDLEEHLKSSGKTIAYPIELCVCGLLETAMEEEGLFRMAGSASKVKKLKAAFDAGFMNLEGLVSEFCDAHVIANALKCYLRELPRPLLTFALYDDWVNAIRIQDNTQKLEALWFVVKKLPPSNYENLRYLVKFLKELSNHQDVNKMSPANIAIVIGPNLLWCNATSASSDDLMGDNSQMGLNMTMTHLYSSILDQLVTNCSYFYPEDIDFYVTCTKPESQESASKMVNGAEESSSSEEQPNKVKRSHSNSSVDEQSQSPPHGGSPKPVQRRKNKPAAPTPPTHKNPLANMRPFSGLNNNSVSPMKAVANKERDKISGIKPKNTETGKNAATKEKREGVWIPPSPKDLGQRKQLDGISSGVPPVKPPPPLSYQPTPANDIHLAKQKFLNEPPPKQPDSPLRHKSSFKSNSVDSTKENNENTKNSSSSTSSTTDNILSSSSLSTGATNLASNFASLPRHFHTENSYKNQRAPRPPSMFGVMPPAPPTVPLENKVSSPTDPEPATTIGFEKLEAEIRKESASSEEEVKSSVSALRKELEESQTPFPRPVPAPRSSLGQSQSFKETSNSSGDAPTVRERPSIMAKPRDLSRRHVSSGGGQPTSIESQEDITTIISNTSQEKHEPGITESGHTEELPSKNNGVAKFSSDLSSPTSKNGPGFNPHHRPPRPQPPAPPKSGKLHESTDL